MYPQAHLSQAHQGKYDDENNQSENSMRTDANEMWTPIGQPPFVVMTANARLGRIDGPVGHESKIPARLPQFLENTAWYID